MGSATAQLLIGESHPHHGGIIPTHQVFLYENDRPVLQLTKVGASGGSKVTRWVPTVQNMLEDALLMVCVSSLRAANVIEAFKAACRGPRQRIPDENLCLNDIDAVVRAHLYDLSKTVLSQSGVKLVFTVLCGSTLINQLSRLEGYKFEMEVCVSAASRGSQ